jgi:hypothetical protein
MVLLMGKGKGSRLEVNTVRCCTSRDKIAFPHSEGNDITVLRRAA